jgi:hypothetical protein
MTARSWTQRQVHPGVYLALRLEILEVLGAISEPSYKAAVAGPR